MKLQKMIQGSIVMIAVAVLSVPPAIAADPPAKEGDHKHDHKGTEKEEHKGARKDLGTKEIGGYKVQVTLIGDATPGKEAIFIISPKGEGEPKSVRAWVGVESGQGSIRTKAEEEKEGEWHAHHQMSSPLPAKSQLWVELETSAGKPKAAFALK